ncbi:MAG TPA: glycosyltransferase, partial [Phycisphaerae bacterium]|nr:glycosyltransferase [Phycisphaerae bacterium]
MNCPRRILFVANGHAVHAQEWIRLLEGTGWDVHAFVGGAVPPFRIDATFHTLDTKAPNPAANRVKPFWPMSRGVARVCRLRFGDGPDAEARRLAALIRRLRPAVVHSLRLQDEGYTALGALDAIRDVGAAWVVSLWGSDLVWFGELPGHRDRIRSVMTACDCVLADCRRDLELSRLYGAAEHQIGLPEAIPGNGGLDPETIRGRIRIADPVRRRVILLPHARDDRFHRFAPVLEALRDARSALRGLTLVFLGADEASRRAIAL